MSSSFPELVHGAYVDVTIRGYVSKPDGNERGYLRLSVPGEGRTNPIYERQINSVTVLPEPERFELGDVYVDSIGKIFVYAPIDGNPLCPWLVFGADGTRRAWDSSLARPLKLLVRNGREVPGP